MKDPDLLARNERMLTEVWPPLSPKLRAVLRDMQGHGWRPRIQQAWRSPAAQMDAYRKGYSGLKWGLHCVVNDKGGPCSLAADIVSDDNPYEEPAQFLHDLASSAAAHGLTTGLHWTKPYDPWHVQPLGITAAAAKRGVKPDWR